LARPNPQERVNPEADQMLTKYGVLVQDQEADQEADQMLTKYGVLVQDQHLFGEVRFNLEKIFGSIKPKLFYFFYLTSF